MIQWLYRYIFRGFGVVMLIAMITILFVAIHSRLRPPAGKPPLAVPASAHR